MLLVDELSAGPAQTAVCKGFFPVATRSSCEQVVGKLSPCEQFIPLVNKRKPRANRGLRGWILPAVWGPMHDTVSEAEGAQTPCSLLYNCSLQHRERDAGALSLPTLSRLRANQRVGT